MENSMYFRMFQVFFREHWETCLVVWVQVHIQLQVVSVGGKWNRIFNICVMFLLMLCLFITFQISIYPRYTWMLSKLYLDKLYQ